MRQLGGFKSGGEGRSRQENLEDSTLMQKKRSSNADFPEKRQIPVVPFPAASLTVSHSRVSRGATDCVG